jgi:hypothetical protein
MLDPTHEIARLNIADRIRAAEADSLAAEGDPAPGRHRLAAGLRRLADRLEPAGYRYRTAAPRVLDSSR